MVCSEYLRNDVAMGIPDCDTSIFSGFKTVRKVYVIMYSFKTQFVMYLRAVLYSGKLINFLAFPKLCIPKMQGWVIGPCLAKSQC